MRKLPTFIRPMLAICGCAFDSEEHLFEVKWDGIRAMVYLDRESYRIVSLVLYGLSAGVARRQET